MIVVEFKYEDVLGENTDYYAISKYKNDREALKYILNIDGSLIRRINENSLKYVQDKELCLIAVKSKGVHALREMGVAAINDPEIVLEAFKVSGKETLKYANTRFKRLSEKDDEQIINLLKKAIVSDSKKPIKDTIFKMKIV